jgi:cytochrome P450 family 6
LRKYSPAAYLTRKCIKDYRIPDSEVVIEKGTTVQIPVLGIHYDEEIYPDPEKFDPGRFTEEKKRGRHSCAHIPFGEGPRICIGLKYSRKGNRRFARLFAGMRFGLLQSKLGLTSLLRNYTFKVSERTKEPLRMIPSSLVLTPEGGIWLEAQKVETVV